MTDSKFAMEISYTCDSMYIYIFYIFVKILYIFTYSDLMKYILNRSLGSFLVLPCTSISLLQILHRVGQKFLPAYQEKRQNIRKN